MIYFVGAGSGAPDLITVRGAELLKKADVIIYAGSLVNPKLLDYAKKTCEVYNSAYMTLDQVIQVMKKSEEETKLTVRLHTGDPSLYGAIREQIDRLKQESISYEVVPGVSSFCGAAASLGMEYTLPEVSQTLIISRIEGRTPVPKRESIASLASHQASMVLFLSAGLTEKLQQALLEGGYPADTPAAIVYKATWPEEKKFLCTVGTIAKTAQDQIIKNTALILVGNFLGDQYELSRLYAPEFTTAFREGNQG
ncbi:MAG: precorrin-4 C(11)-methyltransferase [Clostridiales bacterium]|nr:precorrin-4 C(11)-methyltransferase [Clostridiales bacterium]